MAKAKEKKKAAPKKKVATKKKAAPKKAKKTAAPTTPLKKGQKLIQVDMPKLRKKGWKFIDGFGQTMPGRRLISEQRLAEWEKTGKPSLEGYEDELMEALKG